MKVNSYNFLQEIYMCLPKAILQNQFAALQVARVFLRERKLLELRSPTFLSRALSFPDTLKLLENRNFAGILLSFYGFLNYKFEIL